MLVLISESNDLSTDKVVEWFIQFSDYKFGRINENDSVYINQIVLNNSETLSLQLTVNGDNKNFKVYDIDFFWYRRGNLNKKIINSSIQINNQLLKFLDWEWKICHDFIIRTLMSKKSLGDYFKSSVNKLENLQIALKCGFIIPETIITEDIQFLLTYNMRKKITKPISEAMIISDENDYLDLKTKLVNMPSNNIFPSLIQKKIEKWIELRVFVSYNEVYAMAIFSQNNFKTNIDYRNYDEEKKNRFVPFALTHDIKQKIFLFMEKAGLDTGSIDLILTPQKEYVFLEINPAGNIEMVSEPCNYYIEKRIAEQILERIA
ncbi:MAG: grasp-with-spasm system ATP-grasp peptide maturase [Marinifilum sp.]|jgi:ATP-GRASP peptide maturase of grasp-with-spasm system|nr:grasp-with-spasm system ATP-grasp peptide maturase [Marinifilum sp.]